MADSRAQERRGSVAARRRKDSDDEDVCSLVDETDSRATLREELEEFLYHDHNKISGGAGIFILRRW